MKDNTKLLGTEKISKLLWKQSLPSMIAMSVMALYNVVDTIFIGHGIGSLGIAGLAISFPMQMIIMSMAFSLGIGSASIISRALGAKNKKKAEETLGNFFSLAVIVGLIAMIFGYLFLEKILILFGATENILPFAYDYMKFILGGTVFVIISAGSNNIIRAQGSAKYSMIVMISSAIVNLILDPIFIFIFNWGMAGAGAATMIAQIISFSLATYYFKVGLSSIKIRIKNFILKLKTVKEIFQIGASSLSRNASGSLMAIVMNNSLGFYGGDLAIAAYGIFAKAMMFIMMPMFGFVQGLNPILGYNYGAKKYDRAKESIINAIKKTTIYSILGFIILYSFTKQFVSIFTTDIELTELSIKFIRITFILLPIVGFQVISSGIYQTMGKAKMAFFISILRQAILLVPLVLILPRYFGLLGIFIAYPIADAIASFINLFLLRYEFKLLERRECKFREKAIVNNNI